MHTCEKKDKSVYPNFSGSQHIWSIFLHITWSTMFIISSPTTNHRRNVCTGIVYLRYWWQSFFKSSSLEYHRRATWNPDLATWLTATRRNRKQRITTPHDFAHVLQEYMYAYHDVFLFFYIVDQHHKHDQGMQWQMELHVNNFWVNIILMLYV